MTRHLRDCRRICEDAGLTALGADTRHKHPRILCLEGAVVVPSTPGDRRSPWNMRAFCRRMARSLDKG